MHEIQTLFVDFFSFQICVGSNMQLFKFEYIVFLDFLCWSHGLGLISVQKLITKFRPLGPFAKI